MGLRRGLVIVSAVVGCCGGAVARADHAPAIVVPGRPDVPVIINGRDARGAIVIGDWGLYRPGAVPVTVVYPQPWPEVRFYKAAPPVRKYRAKRPAAARCKCAEPVKASSDIPPGQRHFFPGGPRPPRVGRLEDETRRSPPPQPAESFSRSWSTSSRPSPPTVDQPPIILAPTIEGNRFRPREPWPPRRPQPPRR